MKQIIFGLLALLLVLSIVSISEAKIYDVRVKAHYEKFCKGDIGYVRMADNAPDPITGEHKIKIWKTPYFTLTKTDYSWIVKVDSKKAPSGRIVTYGETYDGYPDGRIYKSDKVPRTEELWDQYIHQTLKKGLTVNFVIPPLTSHSSFFIFNIKFN